jgi:hypothetical protein
MDHLKKTIEHTNNFKLDTQETQATNYNTYMMAAGAVCAVATALFVALRRWR